MWRYYKRYTTHGQQETVPILVCPRLLVSFVHWIVTIMIDRLFFFLSERPTILIIRRIRIHQTDTTKLLITKGKNNINFLFNYLFLFHLEIVLFIIFMEIVLFMFYYDYIILLFLMFYYVVLSIWNCTLDRI